MSQIQISVNNRQSLLDIDENRLDKAIRTVLDAHHITAAEVSVAIVDDPRIHALNREHLDHDYPTDVLSFLYESGECSVDGELVVSTETACRVGREHGMNAHDELLLYVVHGTLHLVGFQDDTDESRWAMRQQERHYLRQLGVIVADEPALVPREVPS